MKTDKAKKEEVSNCLENCYRELFANSTPKGDFDEMVNNTTKYYDPRTGEDIITEFPLSLEESKSRQLQRIIPYENYSISDKKFEEILDKWAHKIPFKNSFHIKAFKAAVYFGASPGIIREGFIEE